MKTLMGFDFSRNIIEYRSKYANPSNNFRITKEGGFYEEKLMTSLYPSNSKLIDHAIRYMDFILKMKENMTVKYETIAENMFVELKKLRPNESIVMKTVESLKKK